jgi:hypothetical protein
MVRTNTDPVIPIRRNALHSGKRSGDPNRDDTDFCGTETEESADGIKHGLPP